MIETMFLVNCPSCRSLFRMERGEVGEGRSVRCTACYTCWDLNADGTNGDILEIKPIITDELVFQDAPFVSSPPIAPELPPTILNKTLPRRQQIPLYLLIPAFIMMAFIGFFIGRETILKTFPKSAAFYASLGLETNVRGLEFREVKSNRVIENGQDVLVIEGIIANITGKQKPVSPLRLSIRDNRAKDLYHWQSTPSKSQLEAGEELPFKVRLASPPVAGSDIAVRFMTDADLAKP